MADRKPLINDPVKPGALTELPTSDKLVEPASGLAYKVANNIDGGSASSVYLVSQNLNGGGA